MEDKALRGNAHNFLELIGSVAVAVPTTRDIYELTVYLYGESGRHCQGSGRITWRAASLLGTTCYLERLRLFARTRFLRTLSTDSRLLHRGVIFVSAA